MTITSKECKIFITKLFCDKCGTEMVYNNDKTFTNLFTKFGTVDNKFCEHKCPNCGHVENTDTIYPKVDYKEID